MITATESAVGAAAEGTIAPPGLAGIYRFLAASMRYPAPDWLNEEYFTALYALLEGLAWPSDLNALQQAVGSDPDLLETLQVEHTRLFINGVPVAVAPPYGSVHVRGEGSLMGRSTERTRAFYRERGFDLASDHEIADYLGHELEFLALLAGSAQDEDEELFLAKYFRPWFAVFHGRVSEGCEHPFYRVVVRLIDFFTREEV